MVDLSKFKTRLKTNAVATSTTPNVDDIRSRFKKRTEQTLEQTYLEKDKRSKAGSLGKSIFDKEKLNKFGFTEFGVSSGTYFLDLLPLSFDASAYYYRELQVHFGVGFSQDAFICMHRFNGVRCFRCETQQRKYRENNKVTDEIKALYPSDRVIYLLLNRTAELANGEAPNFQIQVWNCAKKKVHNEIHSRVRDKLTKKTLDISDLSINGEGRHIGFEVEMQKNFPLYKAFDLYERVSPVPDQVIISLNEFIEEAEANGFIGNKTVDYLLHFPEYDEVKDSMLTEALVEDAPDGETPSKEGEMTGTQQRLSLLKKSGAATGKQKTKEEVLQEIVSKYEKLQAELESLNILKWKSWLSGDGKVYKESANELSKEEAIPLIIEDMLNNECKALGITLEQ
jgi:hypothetical protein